MTDDTRKGRSKSLQRHASVCGCVKAHQTQRVVLTGGPGAGKTAVLEMIKNSFCEHVVVLPESAGIIFGGGFPRRDDVSAAQSAQRAIFYVQRELENSVEGRNIAIALCDRATVDGGAYWTSTPDLWSSVETTLAKQLARYSAVIHMRVPTESSGYNHQNPLRTESAEEAARIDRRIAQLWAGHPNYVFVNPEQTFLDKAAKVLNVLRLQIPECCRGHFIPLADPQSLATTEK